jgi:AGCS family alanine or glycine:cation symporter
LFSFTTIIAGYYYGETSLKYLYKNISKNEILLFKIIVCLLLVMGSVMLSSIIWDSVDIFVALLTLINLYAIIKLRKQVKEEVIYNTNKYDKI